MHARKACEYTHREGAAGVAALLTPLGPATMGNDAPAAYTRTHTTLAHARTPARARKQAFAQQIEPAPSAPNGAAHRRPETAGGELRRAASMWSRGSCARAPGQLCSRTLRMPHDQGQPSSRDQGIGLGRGQRSVHIPRASLTAGGLDRHHPTSSASTSPGTPSGVCRRELDRVVVMDGRPRGAPRCTSACGQHRPPPLPSLPSCAWPPGIQFFSTPLQLSTPRKSPQRSNDTQPGYPCGSQVREARSATPRGYATGLLVAQDAEACGMTQASPPPSWCPRSLWRVRARAPPAPAAVSLEFPQCGRVRARAHFLQSPWRDHKRTCAGDGC